MNGSRRAKIVCILCAVCGAGLIVGGNLSGSRLAGAAFSILSVLLWAFSSVTVRSFTQRYDALSVTTYGIYVGTVATLPVALWELAHTSGVALLRGGILLPLLYIGVICTTAGHTLWNYCLSKMEASTCSLFYPIQPLASMVLGILILHEEITPLFLAGAGLILFGVYTPSRRRPENIKKKQPAGRQKTGRRLFFHRLVRDRRLKTPARLLWMREIIQGKTP